MFIQFLIIRLHEFFKIPVSITYGMLYLVGRDKRVITITMKKLSMALVAMAAAAAPLFAEDHHSSHHAVHPMNEIGISAGCTYAIDHEEFAPILYADYFRRFSHTSNWSFGVAGEYVFSKHTPHLVVGAGVRYVPIHRLHLAVLPGVCVDFPKEHEAGHGSTHHLRNHEHSTTAVDDKVSFALQSEICYELLSYHNFHLAPTFGYSYSVSQGSHVTLGVHLSFGL